MLLLDKVIFLTGGSGGIGFACAEKYASNGAIVVIASNNQEEIETAMQLLGDKHLGLFCDVASSRSVKEAIACTIKKYGKLDVIHNNAGIADPSSALHDTTEQEWDALMNTNVKGIYHTTQHGFEYIKKTKGSILNTSSIVGEIGQELHAAYACTKGAVNALTKSMALDYAKYEVRVNAVSPAAVWTPMLERWNSSQPAGLKEHMESYLQLIHPIGYCPRPDVVADVCTFLISDMARFITGCILPVSGGAELGYRLASKENQMAAFV